jgi:hypothetical protein
VDEEQIRQRLAKSMEKSKTFFENMKNALGADVSKWEFRDEFLTAPAKFECRCGSMVLHYYPIYNKDDNRSTRICPQCVSRYALVDIATAKRMVETRKWVQNEYDKIWYKKKMSKIYVKYTELHKEWLETKKKLWEIVNRFDDHMLPTELAHFIKHEWPEDRKYAGRYGWACSYYTRSIRRMQEIMARFDTKPNV